MRRLSFLYPVVLLFFLACHEHADHADNSHGSGEASHTHGSEDHSQDRDHGHSHEDTGGHGHAHNDDGSHAQHEEHGAAHSITLYGKQVQLFVEFPHLVEGEPVAFIIHFTQLSNHRPVESAKVTLRLSVDGDPPESTSVENPTTAGIFEAEIVPNNNGDGELSIELVSGPIDERFDLGQFYVFPNREQANEEEIAHEDSAESISFLLEQQWYAQFAVRQATSQQVHPNFSCFAKITTPNQNSVELVAPGDGYLIPTKQSFPHAGQNVAKGLGLFSLLLTPSQDDVDPATLDTAIAQAEIQVRHSSMEFKRAKNLADKGLLEKAGLDEAEETMLDAKAALAGAKRRKKLFSGTLDSPSDTQPIVSPITGLLTQVLVGPGEWVTRGQALAKVVNREQLWLEVAVPEAYVGALKDISGVWFQPTQSSDVYRLEASSLVAVGSEINASTRTLPIRFRLPNAHSQLYSGMQFKTQLIYDKPKQAVVVPASSLIKEAGLDVVYVQKGGESFERRVVRLGIRDGQNHEIVSGIQAGEWVVSKGAYLLKLAATADTAIGHGHAH